MRSSGIEAVLWKGRPFASSVRASDSDIDLLVRETRESSAANVLRGLGFVHISNAPWRFQPGVDDWYAVDESSGRLMHIQLYKRLILGNYSSRQIEVPGFDCLFEFDTDYADDIIAAVLRVCRAASYNPFHPGNSAKDYLAEARLLAKNSTCLRQTSERLFNQQTSFVIEDAFVTGKLHPLRQHLITHFRTEKRAGGEGFRAHVIKGVAKVNRMLFKFAVLPRRVVTVPAPIIAIIGSDGSGKSTIAREIAGRLDTKIDTRFVYFGSGDGPTSLARLPLIGLRKMWQSPLIRRRVNRTRGSDGRKASEIVSVPPLAKGLWAVAVARERKAKMRLVKKYSSASIVVVTDRYPQNEFQGIHDGPRLGDWLTPPVERCASKVAQWEQGQYRDLAESPPDLLILLDIDVETAKKRRPEETVAELERRIAVARELRYTDTERLVIDAASPLDVVLNTAMKRVLELIAR